LTRFAQLAARPSAGPGSVCDRFGKANRGLSPRRIDSAASPPGFRPAAAGPRLFISSTYCSRLLFARRGFERFSSPIVEFECVRRVVVAPGNTKVLVGKREELSRDRVERLARIAADNVGSAGAVDHQHVAGEYTVAGEAGLSNRANGPGREQDAHLEVADTEDPGRRQHES